MHSVDGGLNFIQSVDYRYNIRGWLTRINDASLSDGEGDYFGMELAYENGLSGTGNMPLYNGNISAVKWGSAVSAVQSSYAYSYDAMNRLTGADYRQGGNNTSHFDVNIPRYDLNGNILSLQRFANTAQALDELDYSYNGNRLLAVTDNGNITEGFRDGNTSGNDYTYDSNGNMTADANKDITGIAYNHLNLPKAITFTGSRSITYTYDAAGIKLFYLATRNIEKKWATPLQNWSLTVQQLAILFGKRLPLDLDSTPSYGKE